MKNNGLVSIIITCYNQGNRILNTLKSVKDQTYTNWECIVIDDGSTDKSSEIIKEISKVDGRFIFIHQENRGVSIARNNGFTVAKGEYIQFLDGDDTIFPIKLESQIDVFSNNPQASICISDHQLFIENENVYKYYKFEKLNKDPLEQLLYKWHDGIAFPLHAPLYKKSVWFADELPFPIDYTYRCEDWVFNVLIALKGKNYIILDEVLCNYHMYSDNYTSNIKGLATAAIRAAIYLNPKIPAQYQSNFIDTTIQTSLNMYLESEKINILNNSFNWRIANAITKPIFKIFNFVKFK